jgi:hypothetical protein
MPVGVTNGPSHRVSFLVRTIAMGAKIRLPGASDMPPAAAGAGQHDAAIVGGR